MGDFESDCQLQSWCKHIHIAPIKRFLNSCFLTSVVIVVFIFCYSEESTQHIFTYSSGCSLTLAIIGNMLVGISFKLSLLSAITVPFRGSVDYSIVGVWTYSGLTVRLRLSFHRYGSIQYHDALTMYCILNFTSHVYDFVNKYKQSNIWTETFVISQVGGFTPAYVICAWHDLHTACVFYRLCLPGCL